MAIASGTCGTCSWNIDNSGKLTIKPTSGSSGELASPYLMGHWPWYTYKDSVITAVISGSITAKEDTSFGNPKIGDFHSLFDDCANLVQVSGLGNLKNAKDLSLMFTGCDKLTTLDIQNLDVSTVTHFSYMFNHCYSLTSLNLSNFITSQAVELDGVFYYCSSLTTLDLTRVDTRQVDFNAGGVHDLFNGCELLSTVILGNNFYVKPYSQYTDEHNWRSTPYMDSAKNLTNGIMITSDEAFSELTNAQRAGTWQRNVLFTYDVSAYRSTSGVADEDGENATFDIHWATDATTTDRIFRIYQKEAGAVSYPTSPVLTQNVTGNSGNTTLTINNIGDNAYDFKVEFYDGTDTYLAFPSIQTNIRLITIDQTGNVCLYLNTAASSGTTDAQLYDAIVALGWQGDVLV